LVTIDKTRSSAVAEKLRDASYEQHRRGVCHGFSFSNHSEFYAKLFNNVDLDFQPSCQLF